VLSSTLSAQGARYLDSEVDRRLAAAEGAAQERLWTLEDQINGLELATYNAQGVCQRMAAVLQEFPEVGGWGATPVGAAVDRTAGSERRGGGRHSDATSSRRGVYDYRTSPKGSKTHGPGVEGPPGVQLGDVLLRERVRACGREAVRAGDTVYLSVGVGIRGAGRGHDRGSAFRQRAIPEARSHGPQPVEHRWCKGRAWAS
jgi:hypothetical protein